MKRNQNLQRTLSQLYLILVPVLTIVFGLGIGYISYKIYLPVWLVNVVLMALSVYTLGGGVVKTEDRVKKYLFVVAVCFVVPTLLTSMFFGLGAPPYESPAVWVQTITEQRVRYYFLLGGRPVHRHRIRAPGATIKKCRRIVLRRYWLRCNADCSTGFSA